MPAGTKHILNLFAKTITSAVYLCHHAWLRSTDLKQDTKALIKDFSFESEGLFSNTADSVLQDLDKNIQASRTLGVPTSTKGSKSRQWSQSWSSYLYSRPLLDYSWHSRPQQSPKMAYSGKYKFVPLTSQQPRGKLV